MKMQILQYTGNSYTVLCDRKELQYHHYRVDDATPSGDLHEGD